MIESKKRIHVIYEIQRTYEFVENVAKLSNLYSSPREEVMSIAMRNDERALGRFLVNNPRLEYFSKAKNTNSLVHFIGQAGGLLTLPSPFSPSLLPTNLTKIGVKLMKLAICAIPSELSLERVVNLPGSHDYTPLVFAAFANRLHMVQFLAKLPGCNWFAKSDGGMGVVYYALILGHVRIAKYFLELIRKKYGPEKEKEIVNSTNRSGSTGMYFATSYNRLNAVKFLARHDMYKLAGENASFYNSLRGEWDGSESVSILIDATRKRYGEEEVGKLVGQKGLNDAVLKDKTEAVEIITELPCCDPLLVKDEGMFFAASENGNLKIMERLFEKVLEKHGEEKASYMINKGNDHGKSPLMAVCSANHLDAVKVRLSSFLIVFSSLFRSIFLTVFSGE